MTIVIKTIRGREYRYLSWSYRVNGEVVTETKYLGPVKRKRGLGNGAQFLKLGLQLALSEKARNGYVPRDKFKPSPRRPMSEDEWAVHRSLMSQDDWERYIARAKTELAHNPNRTEAMNVARASTLAQTQQQSLQPAEVPDELDGVDLVSHITPKVSASPVLDAPSLSDDQEPEPDLASDVAEGSPETSGPD